VIASTAVGISKGAAVFIRITRSHGATSPYVYWTVEGGPQRAQRTQLFEWTREYTYTPYVYARPYVYVQEHYLRHSCGGAVCVYAVRAKSTGSTEFIVHDSGSFTVQWETPALAQLWNEGVAPLVQTPPFLCT
jgi:hypothetical protein